MKIEHFFSGSTALNFLVGYYGFLSALLLLHTVKTPLYSEITEVLKATPLSSLIAASPFVVLLGIFINHARIILNRILLHRPTYQLEKLPPKLQNALRRRIAIELGVEEADINFNQDSQFEDVKLIIQPKYDEYSIRARWLHDFLECSLLISGFSLIVLAFRSLAYPFGGLEWTLLIGYFSLGTVAFASKPKLRLSFTLAESAMIIEETQIAIEKKPKETNLKAEMQKCN